MTFRVKMEGADRLKRKVKRMPREVTKGIRVAVAQSLFQVQGDVQRLIQRGTRSGKIYQKYKPRREHRASAPGEPPKTDTGRLVSEIKVDIDGDGLGGAVGTNLNYGEWLEFGTTQMAARPWLGPTFRRLEAGIKRRIAAAVTAAIRKVAR